MTHAEIVRKVEWKDLTKLSKWECFIEGNITIPWLVVSWLLAGYGYYWAAIPFSFFFFLAALRQVHNGFHNALGIGSKATWLVLFSQSVFMMAAIHAVKYNHLRHHKYCLEEQDHEGHVAKLNWFAALCYGPMHIFLIHFYTLRDANRNYRFSVWLEMMAMALFVFVAFYFGIKVLMYHAIVMIIGEFFTAFFAVWTVHHDTSDNILIARTQRKPWKNWITMNMFYHMEHHLFPAVPTIKLPELARRIDRSFPELKKKMTF